MSVHALTVTLNPALDRTVRLARLQPGRVNRALDAREDAGGKGINVAACLADWGVATAALGVLGDDNDAAFRALFAQRSILDDCLRVPGQTRTNLKLLAVEDDQTTDINLPGLNLSGDALEQVAARLATHLRPGLPVVLSGSLPAGLPNTAWAQLQAQAVAAGARVVLDSSGEALTGALERGNALPFAIKPNRDELEAWAGVALPDRAALLDAGRALVARGIALVTISLGADGAVFIDHGGAVIARPRRLTSGSTVGAGDAMVAGISAALLEPHFDLAGCARLATAFAASRLASADARRIDPLQVRAWADEVLIEALI